MHVGKFSKDVNVLQDFFHLLLPEDTLSFQSPYIGLSQVIVISASLSVSPHMSPVVLLLHGLL
jgi:hypothetical protein